MKGKKTEEKEIVLKGHPLKGRSSKKTPLL
jgi:hypothetical protein